MKYNMVLLLNIYIIYINYKLKLLEFFWKKYFTSKILHHNTFLLVNLRFKMTIKLNFKKDNIPYNKHNMGEYVL